MKIQVIKQHGYTLIVHHQDTLKSSFIWWIKRKNKHCKGFCPTCRWYFRCQEDVSRETLLEG